MEAWGLTDTGNVREENQDFYRMERLGPETLLAVVCDGMGGARAGNVASRLACEGFCGEAFPGLTVKVELDEDPKCPRCWKHSTQADENGLCPRCAKAIQSLV